MSGKRCILLAGAPESTDLDWSERALYGKFDQNFDRILSGGPRAAGATQASSLSTLLPRWRTVENDTTQDDVAAADNIESTQFLSLGDDFLEHSVAILDDLVSSQILRPESIAGADGDTTVDFTTSFATSDISSTCTSEGHHSPATAGTRPIASFTGTISNLKQIPSADYISSILPQTMTINLIAGVVAVAPARAVRLKKSNAEMDIIELIIGDETRAGFTVSLWLAPHESQSKPADDLREALKSLRAGDVILVQNVALSSFRNSVYGQSLSKRFARNSTLITRMDEVTFSALPPNLCAKLQRVRDWMSDFVGVAKNVAFINDSQEEGTRLGLLPPDTQD